MKDDLHRLVDELDFADYQPGGPGQKPAHSRVDEQGKERMQLECWTAGDLRRAEQPDEGGDQQACDAVGPTWLRELTQMPSFRRQPVPGQHRQPIRWHCRHIDAIGTDSMNLCQPFQRPYHLRTGQAGRRCAQPLQS